VNVSVAELTPSSVRFDGENVQEEFSGRLLQENEICEVKPLIGVKTNGTVGRGLRLLPEMEATVGLMEKPPTMGRGVTSKLAEADFARL
jgi:hypothetical protein